MSSCRKTVQSLWEEFFTEPSHFYDIRKLKHSDNSPDFRHKLTGKGLWIDGFRNPTWVSEKLQSTGLPVLETDNDRSAVIQLIRTSGKKKDIYTLRRILKDKPCITHDVTIANTLIRSYAKCGAVNEALGIFDQFSERGVVSWNALIDGYAEQEFGAEALRWFRKMQSQGMAPDSATYSSALKSCASIGTLQIVNAIHGQVREQGLLDKHILLGTVLVNAYAKCGALKEAQKLFDQLPERDVVSWSALIAGYADHGFGEEACRCYREMNNDGAIPNTVTYTCILKACAAAGALEDVEQIHAQLRDQGLLNKHIAVGTTLVYAYAKCGSVRKARKVFDELAERDVVSWNALIAGYADQKLGDEALMCFREMENNRVTPNPATYASALKACAIVRAHDVVEEIYIQMKEQGLLNKKTSLGNALVNAYAKCGAVKKAQEVFDHIRGRNVVSWNTLIDGYAEHGFGEEALRCFREMQNDGVAPDSMTYYCCLKASAIAGDFEIVKDIHNKVKEQDVMKNDRALVNSLINAYAKCGLLKEAQEVFDQLEERDAVSWSALIDGYAEHGLGEEALACLREMESDGVVLDSVAYACSLKACATVGSLEIVESIHAQMREQGLLNHDIVLGTTLVNAYAKCGYVKEAHEVFDQLVRRNVESWNALLAGYAQLGQVKEMLQLFTRMMTNGTCPDHVTFLVLLNGCSHEALFEEAERVFDMIGTYGLAPSPEHYACMVDLFGCAGQLARAKCFVLDHTTTLITYLGVCQKWVNVDLGKWTFDNLLQLNEKCVSAYVCMSNIYAAESMGKEGDKFDFLKMKK